MSKINIIRPLLQEPTRKSLVSISIGTCFMGSIGGYPDRLFLKVYDHVISLSDPEKIWSEPGAKWDNFQEVDLNIEVIPRPPCR